MTMTTDDTRVVIDSAVASGAITMPLWVIHMHEYLQILTLAGGLLLLVIRIYLAIKEARGE
jgi:hypothetical protein